MIYIKSAVSAILLRRKSPAKPDTVESFPLTQLNSAVTIQDQHHRSFRREPNRCPSVGLGRIRPDSI